MSLSRDSGMLRKVPKTNTSSFLIPDSRFIRSLMSSVTTFLSVAPIFFVWICYNYITRREIRITWRDSESIARRYLFSPSFSSWQPPSHSEEIPDPFQSYRQPEPTGLCRYQNCFTQTVNWYTSYTVKATHSMQPNGCRALCLTIGWTTYYVCMNRTAF